MISEINDKEFNNTLVLVRLYGSLSSGKPYDIDFKEIFAKLYSKSAYFVMKNTNALTSKEFEEIKIDISSVEDAEDAIIKEHLGQIQVRGMDIKKEESLIKEMMKVPSAEKQEGETNPDFERRIKEEMNKVLDIDI